MVASISGEGGGGGGGKLLMPNQDTADVIIACLYQDRGLYFLAICTSIDKVMEGRMGGRGGGGGRRRANYVLI